MEFEEFAGDRDGRLPVVVTGADLPGGLGIARALRDEGTPVYGLALDPASPCCRSSSWTDVLPVREDSVSGWLRALTELSTRHPRQVLMISQDTVVEIVARHAQQLSGRYAFVLPDPGTVRTLGHKTAFATWAREHGFPIPRTEVVCGERELTEALDRLTFPVVVKPDLRNGRWSAASGRTKAHVLHSPEAVSAIPFPLFEVSDRYVVQEWIDGGDADVRFCLLYRDRDGRELGYRTGRKLLQWPVGTGNTAVCTTTDDPELHRLARELFDRAGLVGLASLEVKRDRRDGRYYVTEPTVGRPNLQSNVAAAAGVNLIAMAYRDACGAPAVPVGRTRPAIWLSESNVPPALVCSVARRQLDLAGIGRAVLRCRGLMLAYAGRHDLRPAVAMLAGKARAFLPARFRKGNGQRPGSTPAAAGVSQVHGPGPAAPARPAPEASGASALTV
ncbi:hypothetical protein [Pseudonocardia sp.]|uniref:carboxylate--amine ligase n=1 Tax=Pseudonocardia sp. TaxID=60912 RepID=UPI003D0E93A3